MDEFKFPTVWGALLPFTKSLGGSTPYNIPVVELGRFEVQVATAEYCWSGASLIPCVIVSVQVGVTGVGIGEMEFGVDVTTDVGVIQFPFPSKIIP